MMGIGYAVSKYPTTDYRLLNYKEENGNFTIKKPLRYYFD